MTEQKKIIVRRKLAEDQGFPVLNQNPKLIEVKKRLSGETAREEARLTAEQIRAKLDNALDLRAKMNLPKVKTDEKA